MGRILKWVLGGLLSLILLVGLVITLIVTFVDLNSFKPRIESIAKEQGVDLRIPGELSWSFFPYLGIELGETQLRPLSTPDAQPLASIKQISVGVAVTPLLAGEIKIKRIHLIQPEVYLHRDAQGIANWELIQEALAGDAVNEDTPVEETTAADETDAPMALNLAIADVWLDRAVVQLTDEVENIDLQLTDVSFRAKDVSLDKSFPIEVAAKLSLAEPSTNLNLSLSTNIKLDLAAEHYGLDKLKLTLIAAYPEMLNSPITLTLDGNVDAKMASGEVKLPLKLGLTAPDWRDSTLPELSATKLAIDADLNLNKQLYLLNKLQLDSAIRLDKKQKMLPLQLLVTAEADLEKQLATVKQQLSLDELQQKLDIKASKLLEDLAFSGLLTVEIAQLRKLLTGLGIELPEMADSTSLKQALAEVGFAGDLQKVAINKLDLGFDETQFKGKAEVNLETLAIFLRLAGNELDADRYLPPPSDEEVAEQPVATGEEVAATDEELLPVELLKELNLDIGFTLDKLKVAGLTVEKIDLGLTAKDGLINLQRADLNLYQGTFRNKARIDVRKEQAKLSLTTDLKNLNLRPLLDDLEQESVPFRGKLNIAGDFYTQGTRLSQWLAHSNGKGNLRMIDGAVTGVNLTKEVCEAAASIDGATSNQKWSEDTEFTSLLADINLVNGKLNNQDLRLAIPGFEVSGYGFFHLVAQDFLYNLGIRFSKDTNQQVCPVSSNLAEIRWPVQCKGSIAGESADIKCRPDTKAVTSLVGQMLKDAAKQKVKVQVDENKDKVKDEAKKKLRGLFK